MSFDRFGFCNNINAEIAKSGFDMPTPIQQQAIPAILEGRDVMGLAQTGTGKTAAFVLPAIQRLMREPQSSPRMLILAPTRELVEQIDQVIKTFGRSSGVLSTTVYGGVPITGQIQRLRRGVDIIVGCPGRLLDHIRRRTIDLTNVQILVLDEADHMFDKGFLPDIRRIAAALPSKRQNLLFSATMPADIRRLADELLHNPALVEAEYRAPVATVSHAIYPILPQLKPKFLIALLGSISRESVLVFTRTKHRAKKLADELIRANFTATSLQGNLSQGRRKQAISGFRNGTFQVLVATDIAARGLDISGISHVINYDIPDTAEAYTHRIGRTGRAAKTGDAFTFVSEEDRQMVNQIERLLGRKLDRLKLANFDYGTRTRSDKVPSTRIAESRPPRRFSNNRPFSQEGRTFSPNLSSR